MKHLSQLAFAQRKEIIILFITSVLIGATIIGQAYFFVEIVEEVFLNNQSFKTIVPLLIGLLLVLIGRTAFTYVSGRTGVQMAAKVKSYFRMTLIRKFSSNPVQTSLQGQSGQKVSVLMDAVDELDGYYSTYIPQMVKTMIVPLVILFAVFTQHMYSGLIMIITAPFIPFFMALVGIMTKKKSEEQMEKMSAFSGHFLDTLQGLTTLKLFGRSAKQKADIRQSSLGFRDATMGVLKVAFTSSLMVEFISMLSIGLIALEIAIRLVIYEGISFFSAFFILVLAPEFYQSLKEWGSAFHTGRGSAGAVNKITSELEKEEQEVKWGDEQLETGTQPPTIELRQLTFGYNDGGFALRDVHTEFTSNSQVAIVGRSGAGKTTLLHVVAGLVQPSHGGIVINQQPLSNYKEQAWFDQLSYISQHPYLFSGTIAENIAMGGKSQATRMDIETAAKKAGISELVESLASGFDTVIGEGGRGLSGGEKQRVAIARAFLKQPSVILFDEPTTGLDLQTERILQESMEELSKSSTVITVAHRLHTIRNADRILFLDQGEVMAQGTHDELMASVEEYRNMVSAQQQGGNSA